MECSAPVYLLPAAAFPPGNLFGFDLARLSEDIRGHGLGLVELVDHELAFRNGLGEVRSVDFSGVKRGALLVVDAVGVGNRCVLKGCAAVVTEKSTGIRSASFQV